MSLPKGAIKQPVFNHELMKSPFVLFQAHPDDYNKIISNSNSTTKYYNKLKKNFLSEKNIKSIQKQIINEVFKRTNGFYLIEAQDKNDLIIVIKSIFSQFSDTVRDVQMLNKIVVDEVVPGIINEVRSYVGYLDDINGQRYLMDLPRNVSNKGQKSLPSWLN